LQSHLYYVIFEHLMQSPEAVMQDIFKWLGLTPVPIDLQNLPVKSHESDSYYRFKYRHVTHARLQLPPSRKIPIRITAELKKNFSWFYQTFYPALFSTSNS